LKTYSETLDWLLERLPMYQRQGASAYRPGLESITHMAAYLGHPQQQFPCVHIAGTNGKGSTSHMIAAVLQEAGYKVGLYTSPHLKDFSERIRINGQSLASQEIIDFVNEHQAYFESHQSSFFEMTVGMAFDRFAAHQVDIAVIEVGLGGRLDATNIINPMLSIITNIGLDHTQFLGTTRTAIAKEKAGIIKHNVPILIGEKDLETQAVFETLAQQQNAPLFWAEDLVQSLCKTDLLGAYQKMNVRLAQAAFQLLPQFKVTQEQVQSGLLKVVQNTKLQGRWQILGKAPLVVADVAHNKEGLVYVVEQIKRQTFDRLHLVLGFVQEKEMAPILALFPKEAHFYFCAANNPRALAVEKIAPLLTTQRYSLFESVAQAFEAAQKAAQPSDFIFVGGSTFVVAEVL
jgi:dihydrofolate synthase/folylpolyglutamate synthase